MNPEKNRELVEENAKMKKKVEEREHANEIREEQNAEKTRVGGALAKSPTFKRWVHETETTTEKTTMMTTTTTTTTKTKKNYVGGQATRFVSEKFHATLRAVDSTYKTMQMVASVRLEGKY